MESVNRGTSGLRKNTKGKDVHAHYPRLHFKLPILQQDSGSTSLTHMYSTGLGLQLEPFSQQRERDKTNETKKKTYS